MKKDKNYWVIPEENFNKLKLNDSISYKDIENVQLNLKDSSVIVEETVIFENLGEYYLVAFDKDVNVYKEKAFTWDDNMLIGFVDNKIHVIKFYYRTCDNRMKLYNHENLYIVKSDLPEFLTGGNSIYIITFEKLPLSQEFNNLKFLEDAI